LGPALLPFWPRTIHTWLWDLGTAALPAAFGWMLSAHLTSVKDKEQ